MGFHSPHISYLYIYCALSHRLGRGLDGRVQIKNLADGFIKNVKEKFRVGQLVKAKVLT